MPPTPQITLRVSKDRLQVWKDAADKADLNVSSVIRDLMDAWAEGINSVIDTAK